MEIYRCTIHLIGSTVTSGWNTEKYWAKQQAMKYINDNRYIGHISYELKIISIHDDGTIYADALIRELKK